MFITRLLKSEEEAYSKETVQCCNFLRICFKILIEFGKENLGNILFDFVWICFNNICESDHELHFPIYSGENIIRFYLNMFQKYL